MGDGSLVSFLLWQFRIGSLVMLSEITLSSIVRFWDYVEVSDHKHLLCHPDSCRLYKRGSQKQEQQQKNKDH